MNTCAKTLAEETRPIVKISEARILLGGISVKTMDSWLYKKRLKKIEGTHYISTLELQRFAGILEHRRLYGKTPEERKRGRYKIK